MEIIPILCLKDNYAYLLRTPSGATAVVDPSEAEPVLNTLKDRGWKLDFVWNTHHHFDHVGGNLVLKQKTGCQIIGPKREERKIPGIDISVSEAEPFRLGEVEVIAMEVPGHTLGATSYYIPSEKVVFTGDTLFLHGCGRLFEGTAEQMFASLAKLAALPSETQIYCGHEYTLANGKFALSVDGENVVLKRRIEREEDLRKRGAPTIPGTMGVELETNPFLRAKTAEAFAELRSRKDVF